MILFTFLLIHFSHAGEVVEMGEWKTQRRKCAQKLTFNPNLLRLPEEHARVLHDHLLQSIQDVDARTVRVTRDSAGRIWDWVPQDGMLQISVIREDDLWPVQIVVARHRFLQNLVIADGVRIQAIEKLLKRRSRYAVVEIIEDAERLKRPLATAGLLF